MTLFLLYAIVTWLMLQGYFILARKFNILDLPNARSSHQKPTIRGGGIIFPASFLLYAITSNEFSWWIMAAVTAVTVVSFWDDIAPLPAWVRFPVHLVAAFLVVCAIAPAWPVLWSVVAIFGLVGFVNAFNFMDGINGITGLYATVFFLTLLGIHFYTPINLPFAGLVIMLIALVIFNSYNVRGNAICFAGDVGAVPLALIMGYYWLYLVVNEPSPIWWLLLAVYGVDSLGTIAFRLFRKEPVHKPHRHHTYQNLANEWQWPHIGVSSLYAGLQALINGLALWVLFHHAAFTWPLIIVVFSLLIITYLLVKWQTLRHFTLPFYVR